MLAVAAVLTACTNEDNFINEQLPNTGNEAHTYAVNIPASMGEGAQTRAVTFNNDATTPTATGSFAASEPVYVYNETKKALLSGVLHPTGISADGKSCNLTGTLTGSFNAGDQLTLLYNMIYDDNPDYCFFDYGGQDGSESGVVDGGMATGVSATISGSTLTTDATVTFAMQQAIFRLKFTDGTNPINVKSLIIKCTGSDVASCYNPFNNEPYIYSEQSISVNPTTPTSEYLYVALGINESASPSTLTFTVTDDDGNVYTAPKAAPSSGFKNGKYYYSSAATVLTWQTKLVKPTITNITNVDYAGEFGPDPIENFYYLMPVNDENPVEITISGTSNGYWFSADGGNAIIHLNNLTATHDSYYFISAANLTLDISGANSITCKEKAQAIQVNGTLKLSGNGTLTVTANDISRYGLYASSNYKNGNNSDASVLAAPGYAVTRSATTDNQDGTYTWTYTVTPAINGKFSVSSTKQVYFSKGNLQYTKSTGTWSFMDHQYSTVETTGFIANDYSNKDVVSLFGWGTSGWNNGNTYYLPYSTGKASSGDNGYGYGPTDGSAYTYSLTGTYANADWGHNAISNGGNTADTWRTLTKDEWEWLLGPQSSPMPGTNCRTSSTVNGTANARYAKAYLFGTTHGIIIFPDSYTHPGGVTAPTGINLFDNTNWNANQYTATDWAKMEAAGCVFLPAAGYRESEFVNVVNEYGYYWSSSAYTSYSSTSSAYNLYFDSGIIIPANYNNRYYGCSVRLVRDAN